jgi:energy-coupling factor transporter ATP-binding protein EcfA2
MEDLADVVPNAQKRWIDGRGIRRILIEQLFGQFDYDLDQRKLSPEGSASRLMLLYGDNGSGKTTIIRILFYLLSPLDKLGHKSKLQAIRFKTFTVSLANGVSVNILRENHKERGFEIVVARDGVITARGSYFREEVEDQDADPEYNPDAQRNAIRKFQRRREIEAGQAQITRELRTLDTGMLWVSDKRKTLTTVKALRDLTTKLAEKQHREMYVFEPDDTEDGVAITLQDAVRQIGAWATRQAFTGAAQGDDDVNAVYAAIVGKIAHSKDPELSSSDSISEDLRILSAEVERLATRSQEFSQFGLARRLNAAPLLGPLSNMNSSAKTTTLEVLKPYVEGMKAKFDALEPIRTQLAQFASTLKFFYSRKRVSLTVRQGLRISANSEVLSPAMLSSGEGQLLYILASTLMAKEEATFFIIDEPELSLNVTWQRQLLRSLLDITRDTKIQFIMATHSIELLTRHNEFVVELKDKTDEHRPKEND